MARLLGVLRVGTSALVSLSLCVTPNFGSAANGVGTVISADSAQLGLAKATVGSTILDGDSLSTDKLGRLQIRAGDARLLLSGASTASWGVEGDAPAITLTNGTAVFSTLSSKALSLRAATALFRSQTDRPTIGSVTILNPKELIVRCSRGSLTITVEDDTRVVEEGKAYRVQLNQTPDNSNRDRNSPLPPWKPRGTIPGGKTKFTWYLIAVVALITWFSLDEALESPDRP
jgi:hypothetical protein